MIHYFSNNGVNKLIDFHLMCFGQKYQNQQKPTNPQIFFCVTSVVSVHVILFSTAMKRPLDSS